MKKFTLNLGLKSGRTNKNISPDSYLTYLKNLGAKIIDSAQKLGEYDGTEEPTLVASIEFDGDISKAITDVCNTFSQECIPSFNESEKTGQMHFNSAYKGERFAFDSQYFETL